MDWSLTFRIKVNPLSNSYIRDWREYYLLEGGKQNIYLQESLIDMIVAPFLPITRPIFPLGTSRTERISSSGASPSTVNLSNR